jgi:dTDP-4-dehydrorhamnose reductase
MRVEQKNTILVTGSNGQLGSEIQQLVGEYAQYSFVFSDVADLDITKLEDVQAYFEKYRFSYCINCAAYTNVDKAESDQAFAYQINELGAKNLALVCAQHGATLIHISTDFVFDGQSSRPLSEDAVAQPIGVYGASKLAGELAIAQALPAHVIIRTSWLYSTYGNNFVKTMIRLGQERDKLTIIADQIGSPTYAGDLSRVILQIIDHLAAQPAAHLYGTYHYSNEGVASWYDFAVSILDVYGIATPVLPIPTEAYPTPAKRPHYSVMDKRKIKTNFGIDIPHWRKSLIYCISKLKNTK